MFIISTWIQQFNFKIIKLFIVRADECHRNLVIIFINDHSHSENVKTIATKSRRFRKEDLKFIQETVDNWKDEGIIQPSSSPWRAQVVVVKDEFNRRNKRLCVDFSQTINIYTELDANHLPRIDDRINSLSKYSIFSTFDLGCVVHIIK